MHVAQSRFCVMIRTLYPNLFKNKFVNDIGSANINGSNRYLFSNCKYLGFDLIPYKNVDVVKHGKDINGLADVYISTECLEHDPDWAATFSNMCRQAKEMVLITCATTGRAEHGTRKTARPNSPFNEIDYYKNLTQEDLEPIVQNQFDNYQFVVDINLGDLYFVGFKKPQIPNKRNFLTFIRLYLFIDLRNIYYKIIFKFK